MKDNTDYVLPGVYLTRTKMIVLPGFASPEGFILPGLFTYKYRSYQAYSYQGFLHINTGLTRPILTRLFVVYLYITYKYTATICFYTFLHQNTGRI